jgi:hypothetical protein
VPRLSMIVPFQRNEAVLETTLLSLLESRTAEEELILVHDGGYSDPYHLGRDEAVVIQAEPGLSLAEQLNLAARAACSPILQVVLPGTTVSGGWAGIAIEPMNDPDVHALSVPILDVASNRVVHGLDQRELPHRRVAASHRHCGGPILAGTVIRRRTLLRLGGWSDAVPADLIDLELTLLMQTLGLQTATADNACRLTAEGGLNPTASPFEIGKGSGMIACAYSEIPDASVVIEPLVRRIGNLASGLMNPRLAAERLGWVLGVRDRSLVQRLGERVEWARQSFAESPTVPMVQPSTERPASLRRAA